MQSILVLSMGVLVVLIALPILSTSAQTAGVSAFSLTGFSLSTNADIVNLQTGTSAALTVMVSS